MYLLQDLVGEVNVNGALQALLARHAFHPAPYPNVTMLTDELRGVTPPALAYLIDDLFESVVLYENRATRAIAVKRADGRYEVTLTASAGKSRVGERGDEKEAALKDMIEFGVDDKDGKPLLRERRLVDAAQVTLTMVVAGRPAKAGIDPDNKLIDRKPTDNLIDVEMR
jgi:ABC-2 type transport system permease protein